MIDLEKPIPISNRRAIVGYDPERQLAIIDSKGLRMSSMKYLGEFDPTDEEIQEIERYENSMRADQQGRKQVKESTGLSGRQKQILEGWKDYP